MVPKLWSSKVCKKISKRTDDISNYFYGNHFLNKTLSILHNFRILQRSRAEALLPNHRPNTICQSTWKDGKNFELLIYVMFYIINILYKSICLWFYVAIKIVSSQDSIMKIFINLCLNVKEHTNIYQSY